MVGQPMWRLVMEEVGEAMVGRGITSFASSPTHS